MKKTAHSILFLLILVLCAISATYVGPLYDKNTGTLYPSSLILQSPVVSGGLTTDSIASPEAINAQTGTSYTIQASDQSKVITFNNSSAILVTVPSGLGSGFNCQIIQIGSGQVSFSASGTTINSYGSLTSLSGQFAACSLASISANVFVLSGNLQ